MLSLLDNKSIGDGIDAIRAKLNATISREKELQDTLQEKRRPPEELELERVRGEVAGLARELRQAEETARAEALAAVKVAYSEQQRTAAGVLLAALIEMQALADLEDSAAARGLDLAREFIKVIPGAANHIFCGALRQFVLTPGSRGMLWLQNLHEVKPGCIPEVQPIFDKLDFAQNAQADQQREQMKEAVARWKRATQAFEYRREIENTFIRLDLREIPEQDREAVRKAFQAADPATLCPCCAEQGRVRAGKARHVAGKFGTTTHQRCDEHARTFQ